MDVLDEVATITPDGSVTQSSVAGRRRVKSVVDGHGLTIEVEVLQRQPGDAMGWGLDGRRITIAGGLTAFKCSSPMAGPYHLGAPCA